MPTPRPTSKMVKAETQIVEHVADMAGTYANYAVVSNTPEDVAIDFAIMATTADDELTKEWGPKGIYPAKPLVRVRLNWRVAKGLARALQTQVEMMESGLLFKQVEGGQNAPESNDEELAALD